MNIILLAVLTLLIGGCLFDAIVNRLNVRHMSPFPP